jgi:hypothetical protein
MSGREGPGISAIDPSGLAVTSRRRCSASLMRHPARTGMLLWRAVAKRDIVTLLLILGWRIESSTPRGSLS